MFFVLKQKLWSFVKKYGSYEHFCQVNAMRYAYLCAPPYMYGFRIDMKGEGGK